MKYKKLNIRWFDVLTISGFILTALLLYSGYQGGLFESRQDFVAYVNSFGIISVLIFLFIQIVQVFLPMLPAALTTAAGVVLYGPVKGILYNYIGISVGCITAYLIAKRYGKPLVRHLMPEKSFEKYSAKLNNGKAFERTFFISLFLPLGPDNILSMMAGLTTMSAKKVILIILLGKPLSVAFYSLGWTTVFEWIGIL